MRKMGEAILVNLHTHTIFSDGEQTPEALAAGLEAAGVRYAALTDHDTIEGLARFQEALRKRGIASLTGVELTTQFGGREAHLLGYGFDPEHPELAATLLSLRQARSLEVHSIAESLRRAGNSRQADGAPPATSAAPDGRLDIGEAIALIHRAGGRAFLAHPLHFESDLARLDGRVADLKTKGLDGIEAFYAQFSEAEQTGLRQLARKHDLLVCAGTDFHSGNGQASQPLGIGMPREDWSRFRAAMFGGPSFAASPTTGATATADAPGPSRPTEKPQRVRRRSYVLRIALPTLVAMGLFLAAFWGLILPSFERTLLERKRELIRELTNSAWSILASYERDAQAGTLTREQAQAAATAVVRALRYGPAGKDYFWIQDSGPRMLMHPYRTDLNGQDLSTFRDPRGVAIFVEFAALVGRDGQGYIDYVWQWNDDPGRLEPKESYVKGFAPWGWIIGTGLYTDDVRQEIARIEQSLINASLASFGAIALLLLFVLQQSLRVEKERQEVVEGLHDSTARYQALVEATTEGTLLALNDRCRYANPTFLGMLGYTARQLEFLELVDVLPREAGNAGLWAALDRTTNDTSALGVPTEGCLTRRDGSLVESILTLNPIVFDGQPGYILLARDIARRPAEAGDEALAPAAEAAPVGIFRARAARRGVFLSINPAGRTLLPPPREAEGSQPALADCFADPGDYERVFQTLLAEGELRDHLLRIEAPDGGARFLALSAALVRDALRHPAYIDGLLQDVTAARRQAAGRDALIDRLQASLLFLHEPIAALGRDALVVGLDTTVGQLARMMTGRKATAALVAAESGAMLGIVTDHDLRARVLSESKAPATPIHAVMSAPLIRIPENALIYEALMRMEEHGVRHLAVEDRDGRIVSVIDSNALIQFPRYGPMVLLREIGRATTPDAVAAACARAVPLAASLLGSSARPRHVTSMLTAVCDAATERLVQLAIDDLGPPPAAFVFIAMGSQGRQEQTLLTDQDNGIIFSPAEGVDPAEAAAYFMRLGGRVCDGLRQAGYAPCRGGVMASNPRWCRSLSEWRAGFDAWARAAEPQEIADFSIFLDFRAVVGEAELAQALRQHVHAAPLDNPAFLHHFAQNALTFKPPFRLLGNIYLGGGAAEHAGEIDLKEAMMPIVTFARLYALRHQISQTHTLERIAALAERNLIADSSRDEIAAAYDFLMQLRLRHQLEAIQAGRPPRNSLHPGKLGHTQQELLKQAFAQIAAVQKKIGYDYPGGG